MDHSLISAQSSIRENLIIDSESEIERDASQLGKLMKGDEFDDVLEGKPLGQNRSSLDSTKQILYHILKECYEILKAFCQDRPKYKCSLEKHLPLFS